LPGFWRGSKIQSQADLPEYFLGINSAFKSTAISLLFSACRSGRQIVDSELGTIDLHHGEYSHDPPFSVLHVYGADPTPKLIEALAGFGFVNIIPADEGFTARRA
jgi:hypothetical protein